MAWILRFRTAAVFGVLVALVVRWRASAAGIHISAAVVLAAVLVSSTIYATVAGIRVKQKRS